MLMDKKEVEILLKPYYEFCKTRNQKVTVILRAHERPKYVKIMMDCILNQSERNFFLIVIDNDSKDETPNVIESFNDNRIIFLRWNAMLGGITQFIFNFVKTEYFVCFHDDDFVEEHYLETFIKIMDENTNFSCLSCVCDLINSEGAVIKKAKTFNGCYTYTNTQFLEKYYINGQRKMWVPYPATMYRKSFFEDANKFFNSAAGPAGDQFFWMQVERYGGTVAILGQSLFKYRIHKAQESQTKKDMEIQLFTFLLTNEYYKPYLIKNMKKFYWIIVLSLKNSLNEYKTHKIGRLQILSKYKKLPKDVKKPLKNKSFCFIYKISIICPSLMYILLSKH